MARRTDDASPAGPTAPYSPAPDAPDAPPEYADALPAGPARGRGAGLNPANRFEGHRLHVLGDHLDQLAHLDQLDQEQPSRGHQYPTHILSDTSRSIINYVDPEKSPDIGFRWTVNPYRGCEHGWRWLPDRSRHPAACAVC